MMKYYSVWGLILFILMLLLVKQYRTPMHKTYSALTIIPVADLVESSTQVLFPNIEPKNIYEFLPLSGGYKPAASFACPRIHQLLFNEVVEVVQEKGAEILVKIPNAYHLYQKENSSQKIPDINLAQNQKNPPLNSFWTLKKNVLPLNSIAKQKNDLNKIPESLSFNSKHVDHKNVVTLSMPFTEPKSQISYSAGTRFVKILDESDQATIKAYAFDAYNNHFKTIDIPSQLCIQHAKTNKDKIKQFVALIKQWANLDSGYIPYVWGGSSFIHTSQQESKEISLCMNKVNTSFFALEDFDFVPKAGLDCSGIINRAAQICGIPFYLRLSSSIATMLEELKHDEKLEDGDIIWKPFHVFIVSDIEKNLILESRGHGNGEGRVLEVPLHKVFKDIFTYGELVQAFHNKSTIYRLDKDGNILQEVREFKLLKLASAWKIPLNEPF